MINAKEGLIRLEGTPSELKTDLTMIVDSLVENLAKRRGREEAEEEIMDAVKLGLMPDKERQDYIARKLAERIPELFPGAIKALRELIKAAGVPDDD